MKNIFDELKGCLQTEVTSRDGHKMVLFHNDPFEKHEIEVFEQYTSKEIAYVLQEQCGFGSHKLGSA